MNTSVATLRLALHLLLAFQTLVQIDSSEAINSSHDNDSISSWKTSVENEWHPFSSWTSNSPPGRQYAAATEILDTKLDGTTKEMMLTYGGAISDSDHRTWIYDVQSNSWEAVRKRSGPEGVIHHTLVSLCKTRVLLFGGVSSSVSSQNRICSNETWMFEMKRKEWRHIDTMIHFQSKDYYITPRCRHVASVVHLDNSSCRCKESMIIYSGFYQSHHTWRSNAKNGLYDLWLLRCKDDVSHVYEWVRLGSSAPNLSYPALTSAFSNTIVYFYGRTVPYFTSRQPSWEVWSYYVSTATWNKHSNSSKHLLHSGRIIYFSNSDKSNHYLVLCCYTPLLVFDLITEMWFQPNESANAPNLVETHITIVKIGDKAIAFGRRHFSIVAPNRMWYMNMTMSNTLYYNYWPISPQQLSPVKPRMSSVGGFMPKRKEILLYGGITIVDNQVPTLDNNLHRLDLITLQWSTELGSSDAESRLDFAVSSTATVLLDSVLVIYGGMRLANSLAITLENVLPAKDIWGYYNQATARVWIKYSTKGREPPKRMLHAATAINPQTLVIYGGLTFLADPSGLASRIKIELLYDLWSFTLPPVDEDLIDLSEQRDGSQWSIINQSNPNISYAMSLVSIDKVLYMYGGSRTVLTLQDMFSRAHGNFEIFFSCLNALWTYNLSDNSGWTQMQYKGKSPGNRCFHQSHVFGNKMLLTGGCIDTFTTRINLNTALPEMKCSMNSDTSGVWIYDPKTIAWLQLTNKPLYYTNILGSLSLIWNDFILSFCGVPQKPFSEGQVPDDWNGFKIMKPACPSGTTSRNLKREMCYNCPVGQYSPSPDSPCLSCPHGLTTKQEGSTSETDCSQCVADYCRYGTCTVTLLGPAPTCGCQFGFTKDNNGLCTVATYYIAASGFLAGLALLIVVILLVTKFRKAKKSHNVMLRNKEHELMEVNRTFKIDSRELKLGKRIDGDCPGGYGEVYKAEYREMIVSVKKLKGIHQELDRIALEFEREIEVMRTIRHPNIVLFLGGDRDHDDGCLFLVVEYMPRGSLTSILRNVSLELEDSLKMRFTVDAAKGMRFLHSQRPPRVHRDLKSSNLLVSQKWVVKVADFGSARLVRNEGINQDVVRGPGPLTETAPLLHADYQLSSGIGTPSWRAPEILSGQGYGTPADVYSFGIVMWEIWSRRVPYDDCNLQSVLDLNAAVIGGVRPSVPNKEHSNYVELMRACWAGDSSSRPTFCDIVVRLEGMSENCCLVSEETVFK